MVQENGKIGPRGQPPAGFNVEMNWFRDTVNIKAVPGTYKVEWINPPSGTVMKSTDIESKDGKLILDTPLYLSDIALRIKRI